MKELFTDSREQLDHVHINAYGPPGHGKTFFALSGSALWPEKMPSKEPVVLSDTCVVSFDKDATAGLSEQGISCPYIVDVPKLLQEESSVLKVLNKVTSAVEWAVKEKGVKLVSFDTVSSLDHMLKYHYQENPITNARGEEDRFKMFDRMLLAHTKLKAMASKLPATCVFLFHAKYLTEMSDSDRMKKRASATPGNADIIPAVTGQAADLYTRNTSLEVVVYATEKPGGKGFSRKVYPCGTRGFRGKNRWQTSLGSDEPADLGVLLRKVRKGTLND